MSSDLTGRRDVSSHLIGSRDMLRHLIGAWKLAIPGTVLVAAREVPEGDRHCLPADPFPVLGVKGVPLGAQPVLSAGVAPVASPQLPGEEALKGGVRLVHQRTAALRAKV
jgi:hypothetical protein